MRAPFIFVAAAVLLNLQSGVAADAQDKVTCPVHVEVPCIVRLTGSDNFTTSQNLVLDASSITFDAELNASGATSVVWKGNTNSNNGFLVTVQRSTISGTAPPELHSDLTISGQSYPGGDRDALMLSGYENGKSLDSISESSPEQFCKTSQAGSAFFSVNLRLNAPAKHGRGSVKTTLTFCAASL